MAAEARAADAYISSALQARGAAYSAIMESPKWAASFETINRLIHELSATKSAADAALKGLLND